MVNSHFFVFFHFFSFHKQSRYGNRKEATVRGMETQLRSSAEMEMEEDTPTKQLYSR